MFPKFQQTLVFSFYTNYSLHSPFNSVYKMYTKVEYKSCQMCYTSIVHIMFNYCIQNVYMTSATKIN